MNRAGGIDAQQDFSKLAHADSSGHFNFAPVSHGNVSTQNDAAITQSNEAGET